MELRQVAHDRSKPSHKHNIREKREPAILGMVLMAGSDSIRDTWPFFSDSDCSESSFAKIIVKLANRCRLGR
jgi:hypothetical protein